MPNVPLCQMSHKGTFANSVNPDQMLQNAACNHGLHCLHLGISIINENTKNKPDSHLTENEPVHRETDECTRDKWVKKSAHSSIKISRYHFVFPLETYNTTYMYVF